MTPLLISVCGNCATTIVRKEARRHRARAIFFIISGDLGSDDRSVSLAYRPFAGLVVDGVFCRQFLIDIDTQAGRLIYIEVPFLQFGAAGENFAELVGKEDRFLDAEIPDRQVDMAMRRMTYGGDITGS